MNGTTIPTGRDTTYDSSEVYRPVKEDEGGSGGGGLTRTVFTITGNAASPWIDEYDSNWFFTLPGFLEAESGYATMTLTMEDNTVTLPIMHVGNNLIISFAYRASNSVVAYRGTWGGPDGGLTELLSYNGNGIFDATNLATLVPTVVKVVVFMD